MSVRPSVIFDLGGVLVSVDFARACQRLHAAGARSAASVMDAIRHGEDKARLDAGLLSPQGFAARFCAATGARLSYAEFAGIWCDIFAEKTEVTGMLDAIAARADLLLLSNTDPLHLAYLRERFGFLGKFRHLVLSYEAGCVKPSARIFEQALARVAPGSRAIYFDDVPEFVAAARRCGLAAEVFTDAGRLRQDLQRFGVL